MANSVKPAIEEIKEDLVRLSELLIALKKTAKETSTEIVGVLGKDSSKHSEFVKNMTATNKQLAKYKELLDNIIVINGQVKVQESQLAKFQIAKNKQREKEIKQRERQVEQISRLNQNLNKQKEAENKVSSKAMTGRMIESVKAIGKTNDGLKKMSQYYKALEKNQLSQAKAIAKENSERLKANSERLKEADRIERNKKALQNQKTKTLELNRAYVQLINKQKQAKKTLEDLIVTQGKGATQTKRAQKEYDRLSKKVNQANTATSNFSKGGLKSSVRGFRNLLGAFGVVGGIQIFADMIKSVFSLTKELDSLNFTMNTIIKTNVDLESTQRFLLEITKAYGVELVSTTKRYLKFLAAAEQSGISLSTTENIFRSVTKAASTLGLKTDELTGVYLALEQMLSKGKVTTEELRRQLGERLPGAMGIMAAALDVSIPKLDEMLKKGQVLSADALPKFAKALELAFGIKNVKNIDNLVAAQNRLSNSWTIFIKNITEGDSAISKFFKGAIEGLNDFVDMLGDLSKDPKLKLQSKIIEETKTVQTELKFQTDVILKQQGVFIKDYNKNILDARVKLINLTGDKKAYAKQEEELRKFIKLQLEQDKLVEVARKKAAAQNIKEASEEYKWRKNSYDAEIKKLQELENKMDNFKFDLTDPFKVNRIRNDIEEQKKIIEDAIPSYAKATAAFDIYRKMLQEDLVIDKNIDSKVNRPLVKPLELVQDAELSKKTFEFLGKTKDEMKLILEIEKWRLKTLEGSGNAYLVQNDYIGRISTFIENMPDNKIIISDKNSENVDKLLKKLQKLETMKDIFKEVTDTFSEMFDIDISKFDFLFDNAKNTVEDWAKLSKELIGSVLDASLQRYDIELQEAQRVRDVTLNNDLATEEAKRNARLKFEREERRIKAERAKKERENALIKIAVDTAVGVVQALPNIPLSIAVAGLGALQAGIVASQPLPQFEKGGVMQKDGLAITQEKRPEPIVSKDGKLKTMGTKGGDALTYLEKGDRVFKSQDAFFDEFDMQRSVLSMNAYSNGDALSEKIVDMSLLREIGGLRGDIDKMGRRLEKLASRPINNTVKVDLKQDRAY